MDVVLVQALRSPAPEVVRDSARRAGGGVRSERKPEAPVRSPSSVRRGILRGRFRHVMSQSFGGGDVVRL